MDTIDVYGSRKTRCIVQSATEAWQTHKNKFEALIYYRESSSEQPRQSLTITIHGLLQFPVNLDQNRRSSSSSSFFSLRWTCFRTTKRRSACRTNRLSAVCPLLLSWQGTLPPPDQWHLYRCKSPPRSVAPSPSCTRTCIQKS
jgi:hypothetical protein